MSLDVKETVKAIRDMIPIIDPEEDFMTIATAEEQMALTHDERQKDLHDAHRRLKQLAKILDAARAGATRPATIPSAEAHGEAMQSLDATRLSLAKAINDAESALAGKEAELARLREDIAALEGTDAAAEHELDATALRLAMYRGVGFEPVVDKETKMLIRSESGDVHSIAFDPRKPDGSYVDLLWKLASS